MSTITLVTNGDHIPKAKSLLHKLTLEARSRTPSSLKSLYHIASRPGMIALAGGLPRHELFPFQSYSASVHGTDGNLTNLTIPLHDTERDIPLSLQYLGAPGLNALRAAVKTTVMGERGAPQYSDWDIMISGGNTASFDNCLRMLCERGDGVLVEEWCYSSALEQMRPLGIIPIPVKMDEEGFLPNDIPRAIREFREKYGDAPRVDTVYVVPTGQNPTGALMGLERRKELLRVASEMDLIIVEDDPYNALELPPYAEASSRSYAYKGTEGLFPSVFALDTEGRVIYLYTFSKVITPGMRVGFTAASEELLTVLKYFQETSVMFASGFSQGLLLHLLQAWGRDGLDSHLKNLQEHYTVRRDWVIDAARNYLYPNPGYGPTVEYVAPEAGMFVWFK
ncbi:pyridoxal phosphate-dependent transferase [Chytridium lagenaria]|nr:pyridoxal phosphate-dependent transferase [Chytridium lagenaria]